MSLITREKKSLYHHFLSINHSFLIFIGLVWVNYLICAGFFAPLPWLTRLKIAVGAAKGLAFLHETEKPVIYRDFKASNILLDPVILFQYSPFSTNKSQHQVLMIFRTLRSCLSKITMVVRKVNLAESGWQVLTAYKLENSANREPLD